MQDQPTPTPTSTPPDRWQVSFWRLVQLVGLLIMCYEVLVEKRERPWLDLAALAMMLGAQGILMLLRVARRVMNEVPDDE